MISNTLTSDRDLFTFRWVFPFSKRLPKGKQEQNVNATKMLLDYVGSPEEI